MATFKQAIERALQSDQMRLLSVNQNLLEVSRKTKKKSGFVKSAVTEELAEGLLHRSRVAFLLHIDADEMNAIVKQLDEEASLVEVYCTEYPEEGSTLITKEEYEANRDELTVLPKAIETNEQPSEAVAEGR